MGQPDQELAHFNYSPELFKAEVLSCDFPHLYLISYLENGLSNALTSFIPHY